MTTLTGSEPNVGSFIASITPDGDDWCILMTVNGHRVERWCSTIKCSPSSGVDRVYAILRENGFTMAGFQTAEVIKL